LDHPLLAATPSVPLVLVKSSINDRQRDSFLAVEIDTLTSGIGKVGLTFSMDGILVLKIDGLNVDEKLGKFVVGAREGWRLG
jgi:hypothetical protein